MVLETVCESAGEGQAHEAGVCEALDDLRGKSVRGLLMGVALRGFIVEWYAIHGGVSFVVAARCWEKVQDQEDEFIVPDMGSHRSQDY